MKVAVLSETSFGYKDLELLAWLKEQYPMMEPMFKEKTMESKMIPKAKFTKHHELKVHKDENKWHTTARLCRAGQITIILRGSQKDTKNGLDRNHKILNYAKNYSRAIYLLYKENGVIKINNINIK